MLRSNKYEEYNKNSSLQKRVISENNFVYKNHLSYLSGIRDKKVLDVGCGTGTISFFLATKNNDVTGVDISKRAIKIACKNAKHLGLENKVKFKVCDYPNGKIADSFDLILLNDVLEHIPCQSKALKTTIGLLKENGIIFLSVPLKEAPLYRLGLLKKFDKKVGHVRRYSVEEFTNLIVGYGLTIEKIELREGILKNSLFTNRVLNKLVRFIRGPLTEMVYILDNVLVKLFGPSQLLMVAKK